MTQVTDQVTDQATVAASGGAAAGFTPSRGSPVRRWELAALAGIVITFGVIGAAMIERAEPLGHDEAVYALQARRLAGIPAEGAFWAPYRAPGLPALISIGLRVNDGDFVARGIPLLLAVGVVVLTWAYARHLLGPPAGLVAAGLVAATPGFLRWSWQIGVDIPGTFFGLAAILAFLRATSGERVSRWAYLSIPLGLAAAYTRFGAPILVASGMTVIALVRWRVVRGSPTRTAIVAVGTALAMGAVLYLPFMTGSDTAPARAFGERQVAKDLPFWQSYADFAGEAPGLFGPVVAPLVAFGLALAIWAAARRRIPARAAVIAGATFLVFFVGLNHGLAQGFEQYLTPAVPFLAALAAAGLTQVRLRRQVMRLSIVLVSLLAFGWAAASSNGTADLLGRRFTALRSAAVRTGAGLEHPCVVLTSYVSQIGWYSRCAAYPLPGYTGAQSEPHDAAEARAVLAQIPTLYASPFPPDAPAAILLAKGGKRQPNELMMAAFETVIEQRLLTVGNPQYGRLLYITVDLLRL